jgi:ABC transport system ATP-binding/permease protein
MGQLVVSVDGQRRSFTPGSTVVFGRGNDCQIVITDTRVSRRHLEVSWQGGAWFVRDLGSANGTFRDGRQLGTEPVAGTVSLRLGHASNGPLVELSVAAPARPQPPPPPPPRPRATAPGLRAAAPGLRATVPGGHSVAAEPPDHDRPGHRQ